MIEFEAEIYHVHQLLNKRGIQALHSRSESVNKSKWWALLSGKGKTIISEYLLFSRQYPMLFENKLCIFTLHSPYLLFLQVEKLMLRGLKYMYSLKYIESEFALFFSIF